MLTYRQYPPTVGVLAEHTGVCVIELSVFIAELRNQLNTAMSDGGPGPLRFELGAVEIEATVVADQARGATAKVNLWVVDAGVETSVAASRTHRISVTLQPVLVPPDGSHRSVLIAGRELTDER
jgi:hypothetical protein